MDVQDNIKLEILTEDGKEKWDQYVKQHEQGSIYHLTVWNSIINSCFDHKTINVLARKENGDICGVLPLVHMKSKLFGNSMYSLPYFNYGGILSDSPEIKKLLIQYAIEITETANAKYLQLRESEELSASDFSVSTSKVNMILSLPDSTEALGKLIGSKRRSQIKRPIREGVEHKIGGVELLDDFYYVFCKNMRDLGTPVYSKQFFHQIMTALPDNTKLCIVYWQNEAVSGGFLLTYKDKMEIPWASTLKHANKISVNMYLYWQILSYAIEQEFKQFDFGRSSIDAGTYKFKKQWGAEPQQCYWHHWTPPGCDAPNLSPTNSKFDLAIRVWQKLPLSITKLIGPHVVKNLP